MVKFSIQDLSIWFGSHQVLKKLNMDIESNEILTIIGPSNSGKTTFLRMLNRLNELQSGFRMSGEIRFGNEDLKNLDPETLRKKVGMVFALPLSLPLSIFDNVAYGMRMHGETNKRQLSGKVEKALNQSSLWDEVKDRLDESAFKLSGGQQQRLCIARTLAVEPEVILFDEPCSGLDPISTAKVEDAMLKLKERYTIVLVTNNVKQAARVGDRTAFFLNGKLIEIDTTDKIFTTPKEKSTEDYVSGKFG
ncbi:MAG: phosphate ABC transporter ATP-binding protein [Candidatus Omnitrophica bacterium CG1_02_49_16]|nr:MAG: phosphate ABC transporter ATP-binding protein [Candidatus Omnitrophica bacterium CG1_02_49_16]